MIEMVNFLSKEFEIKTLPADRFIGIDITRDRSNLSLHLGQPDYCQKVIERFNMTECKPLNVPADPCSHLSPEMCPSTDEEIQEMSRTPYLEAEVIALVEAAKEAIWLRRFIRELGFPRQTVPLFCDNQSAISLIRNPVLHSRVKHMSVRLSFTREAQEKDVINVDYVGTEDQMADGFTKALPASRFQFLRESISIREISE